MRQFDIFFLLFSQKIGVDASYKLSSKKLICVEYQSLFSWKTEQNIINVAAAEFPKSLVKVNITHNSKQRHKRFNVSVQ